MTPAQIREFFGVVARSYQATVALPEWGAGSAADRALAGAMRAELVRRTSRAVRFDVGGAIVAGVLGGD